MKSPRTPPTKAGTLFTFLLFASWVSTAAAQAPATDETAQQNASENPTKRAAASPEELDKPSTSPDEADEARPATAPQDTQEKPDGAESETSQPPAPSGKETDKAERSASERRSPAERNVKGKAPPLPPKIDYSSVPWTYHQKRFDLGANALVGWTTDPAFDLFQAKDGYATWEVRGAVGFLSAGKLSIAATASFNHMTLEGEVRALPSFLRASRAHVGAEARYHFAPRVYVYGRAALGAFLAHSRLGEANARTRMELTGHGFSGGAYLGGAVRVAGSPDGRVRAPRLHVFAEGGLEYDSALNLTYKMAEEGALRPAPVELGALSLGGPRIALGALVSY